MSTCSNCYNGCTEIVSDRCVKYTGIDVPVLGIKTGDSLSFVEQALITFLVSTLDGTGIKIDLGSTVVCTLVQQYLPTCGDLTIVDISKALIQAACDLQVQVTANSNAITTLNADYTIGCLTGVTASSDTHAIVQAVINKLCTVDTGLTNLTNELHTMYSSNGTELNDYISSFLASQPSSNLASSRMIPYAPIAYFGPLSNYPSSGDSFGISGAGSGYWDKVYLCNGANPGVPDLRGWTLVGVTTGMFGGALNSIVDPAASPNNPNYTITGPGSLQGTTAVTLGIGELPNHTHTASTASAGSHNHYTVVAASETTTSSNSLYDGTNTGRKDLGLTSRALNQGADNFDYELTTSPGTVNAGKTSDSGVHTHPVTVDPFGGNGAHANIQPSKGCYYIIYIP
jgi:microcystin-dependent protein